MSAFAPRLSALIITRNEIHNIDRCLSALSFCDEIVVVDAESNDGTADRARRYTPKVFVEPWRGFAGQKSFALEHCTGRWVLWIDADEVARPELARAIRSVVERDDPRFGGYRLRRRVNYLGRWIRFGSFGNDWVLRLFRREGARFTDHLVHEELRIEGGIGKLPGLLEHWSYRDLAHHREKIESMATLWATQEHARGRRARLFERELRAFGRWIRLYLLELGCLNGSIGWTVASMGALYVRRKYEKLAELDRSRSRG